MKIESYTFLFHAMISRMLSRKSAQGPLKTTLDENPVIALLGPRQCRKSTLVRQIADHLTERIEALPLRQVAQIRAAIAAG